MSEAGAGANLFAERVFERFRDDDPMMTFIGEVAISAGETPLVLRLDCHPHAANPQGILHGGALSASCDVAMYEAAKRGFGADCVTVAQEMKFVRAGSIGTALFIACDIVNLGRRTAFLSARALQGGRLIAHATGQFAKLQP